MITGASSGIGRAAALAFARQGTRICIGDISAGAGETVDPIKKEGSKALFVKTDVTQATSVEALVGATVDALGAMDCTFNNSGILPPTTPLAETEDSDFDKVIAVDLKGVFLCMEYEICHMLKAGGGAIVNCFRGRCHRRPRHVASHRRQARRDWPDQSRRGRLRNQRHPCECGGTGPG
jgi:NAD(P)-dependent dehydrogenase (short-subunit alcohol dehydrogenase family)